MSLSRENKRNCTINPRILSISTLFAQPFVYFEKKKKNEEINSIPRFPFLFSTNRRNEL